MAAIHINAILFFVARWTRENPNQLVQYHTGRHRGFPAILQLRGFIVQASGVDWSFGENSCEKDRLPGAKINDSGKFCVLLFVLVNYSFI